MKNRRIAVVAVPSLVVGCNLLLEYDAARPQLAADDVFDVTPECVDVPLDAAAIASVPQYVTMIGRRAGTKLGAEGVPVSVRLGACSETQAGGAAGAGGVVESGASVHVPHCGNGATLKPLDRSQAAAFRLQSVERGCAATPGGGLECTLGPDGSASFGILGGSDASIDMQGYLPICIRPAGPDSGPDSKLREIHAIPRIGEVRVGLGVVRGQFLATPLENECNELSDCSGVRGARLTVGMASLDVASGQARNVDLVGPNREVELALQLTTTSSSAMTLSPWLQASGPCDVAKAPAEGSGPLPVKLPSGALTDFVLCYSDEHAAYRVSAVAKNNTDIRGFGGVEVRGKLSRISVERENGEELLVAERCGEGREPVSRDIDWRPGDTNVRLTTEFEGTVECTLPPGTGGGGGGGSTGGSAPAVAGQGGSQ